ncbi:MAG: RNase P subunit p30 family protein [archaeon]
MFIDIVRPQDNEKEFIEVAERMGMKGIIFLYTKQDKKILEQVEKLKKEIKLKLLKGLLIKDTRQANKAKKDFNLLFGLGTRENFENKSVQIIFDVESDTRKDYIHNRNSGLNQVHCKLAKEKNKIIAFSFSQVLNSDRPEIILGRLIQNIVLCRKYKNDFVIASFAQDPYEMRCCRDYEALLRVLGATPKQAKEAKDHLGKLFL